MPTYKLIYFPGRGRGEVSRYILAAGGADFEDCRVTMDKWPEVKKSM